MKRIGALHGMRWLVLSLIFQTSYTAAVAAQETDDTAIELNPLDYVPLAVGNRWTYGHYYVNHLHGSGEFFDIPGYPPGSAPDSLILAEKIVTIEITHTEVIDGLEYFVFSGADYDWPPLPDLFWGGKKVRLSDEGFLVFRWNGQDIPVYDFGYLDNPHKYTGTLPSESGTAEIRFTRFYVQYRLSRVSFVFDYGEGLSRFLQGYGMGRFHIYVRGFHRSLPFQNVLAPISATISGEEIVYEQVRPFYAPHFESTGLGQVDQIRMHEGFDFSEGTNSESYNDFDLILGNPSELPPYDFFSRGVPHLYSEIGVANLGKMDFGLLISEGIPPDLRLDARTALPPREDHTYVIWSREGGVALLYIFDTEYRSVSIYQDPSILHVNSIKFDWVYYPDGLPAVGTSVQPISWGQLKYLTPGRRSTSQVYWE